MRAANALGGLVLAARHLEIEGVLGPARAFQKHHRVTQMFNTRAHRGRDWAVITNAAATRPIRTPAIMSEA